MAREGAFADINNLEERRDDAATEIFRYAMASVDRFFPMLRGDPNRKMAILCDMIAIMAVGAITCVEGQEPEMLEAFIERVRKHYTQCLSQDAEGTA